jgi:hypothetical protein
LFVIRVLTVQVKAHDFWATAWFLKCAPSCPFSVAHTQRGISRGMVKLGPHTLAYKIATLS